jgi:methylthioribose-1-phosphate isomerase
VTDRGGVVIRELYESLGLRLKTSPNLILEILDQRVLPDEERWIRVETTEQMCDLIKTLAVRGAPLIGVAAAMSLAVNTLGRDAPEMKRAARDLRAARPTAVNLMWAMDRMLRREPQELLDEAVKIFDEDVEMCRLMGKNGSSLVWESARNSAGHETEIGVLTICNTGGLATVGSGTAFSVLQAAHEEGLKAGRKLHVYACETRPLLQGARLTTWELSKCGIPHTLITDGMAATLMKQGRIQCVFTGADRVSARGDFANKIGTYSLAVLARHHGIPFYPVAPMSTVDRGCVDGDAIEIEQREPEEVRGFVSPTRQMRWAPEGVKVFNPSFDVTPAELVTKLVLDKGVYAPQEYRDFLKATT